MAQDFGKILQAAGFKSFGVGSWKREDKDPNATTRVQISEDYQWFTGYNNENERMVCGAMWELESTL